VQQKEWQRDRDGQTFAPKMTDLVMTTLSQQKRKAGYDYKGGA